MPSKKLTIPSLNPKQAVRVLPAGHLYPVNFLRIWIIMLSAPGSGVFNVTTPSGAADSPSATTLPSFFQQFRNDLIDKMSLPFLFLSCLMKIRS